MSLEGEIRAFRQRKEQEAIEARQNVAFFLMSGIDLSAALEMRGEECGRIQRRLERLIERERLKGARRHWSYDLNRHIALKQALDRLCGREKKKPTEIPPSRNPRRQKQTAPKGAARSMN
ncbi:MAG TPA: cytoplasmic protein [Rhizobiaceae bacterium]|nr:cytoplasmic protein [Rhizobiaceae bacterium]